MFEDKFLFGIVALALVYLAYRVFLAMAPRKDNLYEQQMQRILNSEEYKVKGKFED